MLESRPVFRVWFCLAEIILLRHLEASPRDLLQTLVNLLHTLESSSSKLLSADANNMIFCVRFVFSVWDTLYLKNSDEACCSVPSGRHTQTHRCASSLVDCRWPQLIELAKGGQLCSWGRPSGQLRREMVAWLRGTAEQSYHDPGRHTPKSAHCAALVSPGRVVETKEQGTSPDLHFGVFGQLQGPGGAPRGPSAGLESESDPEMKAEQWTLSS